MEIKYQIKDGIALTPCPNVKNYNVFSFECIFECVHFDGYERGNKVVTCNYREDRNERLQ